MAEGWRETNRAWWDERVPIHAASDYYDLDRVRRGGDTLRPFEIEEVGPVEGLDLAHLQCHLGVDTLGWARRGARVTGLDFSAPAIETARRLASDAGLAAEFVHADVYDAPRALGGRDFDVVYTGFGALNWLPDLRPWADVVARLLRPGGFVYLAEFHPIAWVFGDAGLDVVHDYFRSPQRFDDAAGSYADREADTVHNQVVDALHGLGAVVSAIAEVGLTVEHVHEHDVSLFARWPWLERYDDGTYHFPEGRPRIPLVYTVRARRAERPAERRR
jgi:SAM-dependent methyltransferase